MSGNVKFYDVKMVAISSLHDHPANDKIRSATNDFHSKLQSAIDEDGFTEIIVVNDRNHPDFEPHERVPTIVSGHRRKDALKALGEENVPAIITTFGRAHELKKVLRDNKLKADWADELGEALYELEQLEKGAANEAGWEDDELKKLEQFADEPPKNKKPAAGSYSLKQLQGLRNSFEGNDVDAFLSWLGKALHESN